VFQSLTQAFVIDASNYPPAIGYQKQSPYFIDTIIIINALIINYQIIEHCVLTF